MAGHHGGMDLLHGWTRTPRPGTVLLARPDDLGWTLAPIRVRDRVGAHLRSLTLDAELAAGRPVAADRLRAVRAAMLVDPALRHQLAEGWLGVLGPDRGIIPVRRPAVLAARDEISELVVALRCAGPVAPRGVALANLLLTDGTGPLYALREGPDLRDQLRIAIQQLSPTPTSLR
jgi:hypothetical protein